MDRLIPIDTSNLCLEVNHPLIPIYDVNDPTGEIGVCVLAALNWLEIKDDNLNTTDNKNNHF